MGRADDVKRASLKKKLRQVSKARREKQKEINTTAAKLFKKGITSYGKNKTLLKQSRELDALLLQETTLKDMLKKLQ